jgi:hypothetical protein
MECQICGEIQKDLYSLNMHIDSFHPLGERTSFQEKNGVSKGNTRRKFGKAQAGAGSQKSDSEAHVNEKTPDVPVVSAKNIVTSKEIFIHPPSLSSSTIGPKSPQYSTVTCNMRGCPKSLNFINGKNRCPK